METKHYIVKNIAEFSNQTEAMEKLEEYLDCIEEFAFPAIEEVFGQTWNDSQINIKLNNSTGGGRYHHDGISHIVEMGINNRNIQKKYPENLWGCLFHETHHAFLRMITDNKRDGKILNGGRKDEVFNYAFMATTYLRLKEKNIIEQPLYEYFLGKLEMELLSAIRKLFNEYVNMFSINIENFAKFVSYVKSSNSIFTDISNFRQDLDEVKKIVEIAKNSKPNRF